jgi:hypothetical protein
MRILTLRSVAALVLVACGSGVATGPTGDGGLDAAADGSHYVPPADGPFACGSSTCTPTQFCVQECTCGGVRQCDPVTDAGTCPPGETLEGNCCVRPCSNPPPACQDTATCGGPQNGSRYVNCPCPP